MRHDPMTALRRSPLLRGLLSLVLLVCCAWPQGARAADDTYIRLKIDDYDSTSISYRVESNCDYTGAMAITTTYSGGRQCETKLETFDIKSLTDHQGGQSFSKPYDSFKVILVDATSFKPICREGKLNQVRFFNGDGELISTQTVATGQSADPPLAPTQDGYIFSGWSGAYDDVTGDSVFTPVYVEEDSTNIFTVSSAEGAQGDEVTISVALTGTVLTCAYDMRLVYDDEVLEYVSHNSAISMDVVAFHIADQNMIRFNFSSTKNRTLEGGIMDVTFKIKDSGRTSTPVRLEPVSVLCLDPEEPDKIPNVEYTACEGVVILK